MPVPFRLSAIRLINFHNFIDETIPVKGSLFLLGENGSGKTTVLDAVHFALTGGVEMEWNAAARLTPRGQVGGRSLQGILLRQDQEKGVRQPDGAIGYAALELTTAEGKPAMVVGCGGHARTLDSQVDVWGFSFSGSLASLSLLTSEEGRCRVLDRTELSERNPAIHLFDKGRYRTMVAEQLFGSRAGYEESLRLIKAGKAYRELVTRIQDPAELFRTLLPPPDVSVYEEILKALDDIDKVEANRQDLEEVVKHLHRLLGMVQELDRAREDQARYVWLQTRATRGRLADSLAKAEAELAKKQDHHQRLTLEQEALRQTVADCAAVVERVRTSQTFRDQQRLEELQARLLGERRRAAEGQRRLQDARTLEEQATTRRQQHGAIWVKQRAEIQTILGENLPATHIEHRKRMVPLLDSLPGSMETYAGEFANLMTLLENEQETLQAARLLDRGILESTERQIREIEAELADLHSRGELLPAVEGIADLYRELHEAGIEFQPLYRCLEPLGEHGTSVSALLEQILGPAELAAVVVEPAAEVVAQARILARPWGIPVIDAVLPESPISDQVLLALVDGLVGSGPGGPAAMAYLHRRWGEIRFLATAPDSSEGRESFVTFDGLLRLGGSRRRIPVETPRFLGFAARQAALANHISTLQQRLAGIHCTAQRLKISLHEQENNLSMLRGFARQCQQKGHPPNLRTMWAQLGDLDQELDRLRRDSASRLEESRTQEWEIASLEKEIVQLEEALRTSAAAGLMAELRTQQSRHQACSAQLEAAVGQVNRMIAEIAHVQGEVGRRQTALGEVEQELTRCMEALRQFAGVHEYGGDVERFVFQVRRGAQIKAENLPELIRQAQAKEVETLTRIDSAEGLRHALLQNHSLVLDRSTGSIRSSRGVALADLIAGEENQVVGLSALLDEKNRSLLERLVVGDLVNRLNSELSQFQLTLKELNSLLKDLRFGETRYKFRESVRGDYRRIIELLRKVSDIDPQSRRDIQEFFQAHVREIRRTDGDMPPLLDYREWFEVVLQAGTGDQAEGVSLTWANRSIGSGGEQAVPNYLILLSLAKLHFDHSRARLRLLLLDEAFFGIDAGRRDELLRFADRLEVGLIVAHPELDGVTEAMRRSTTLLIEKTPGGDIYLGDLHWEKAPPQPDLFAEPTSRPEAVITIPPTGSP